MDRGGFVRNYRRSYSGKQLNHKQKEHTHPRVGSGGGVAYLS